MKLLEPDSSPLETVELDAAEAALERGASVAVRIAGDAEYDAVAALAPRLAAIVIDFGAFRDGRGFSLGTLLKERAGFKGELRAAGDLLPDQAWHLARSGFDSVQLNPGALADEWTRQLDSFTAVYQPAADGQPPVWALRAKGAPRFRVVDSPADALKARVAELNARYRDADAKTILQAAIREEFPGKIAILSSFGAEAAVSLHLVSEVDKATPVVFIDTDRHFAPTLSYRDQLVERLGLTNVEVITPSDAADHDAKGDLWRTNPDLCCTVRKVRPLEQVNGKYAAMITGRKRFHGGDRLRLPVFELVDGQVKVSPLANWTPADVEAYYVEHDLPRHPLVEGGYRSIGCWPCTQPSADAEDVRAGRWAGSEKRECGIHLPSRWAAEVEHRAAS